MKFMKLVWYVALLFNIAIGFNSAEARWAKIDDFDKKWTLYDHVVTVNADGTYEEIIESKVKILKEGARNHYAHNSLVYNSNISSIEIIEAKTIYQNQTYNVSKDLIEDKPLASHPQGFDELRQIIIAFPHAEIGAEIYLKYKRASKPMLENFFDFNFAFFPELDEQVKLKIKSALPLYIVANNPKAALNIKTDAKDKWHALEVTLKEPLCLGIVNEEVGIMNPKHYPWLAISSINKWESLGALAGEPYLRVLQQPLPELLQNIAQEAAVIKQPVEQINMVTAALAEKIQYMGDWLTVKGKLAPHDLAHIAEKQLGDCKDFTVSAGAILKQLGYGVNIATVDRGEGNLPMRHKLPQLGHFNHVLLKVTTKQGEVLWIDPTNFMSMAGKLFPDIAGKTVLVFDGYNSKLEEIPAIEPRHMQLIITQQFDLSHAKAAKVNGKLLLKGEYASDLTGSELYMSKDNIEDQIIRFLGGDAFMKNRKVILPELKSRIVSDLEVKYSYTHTQTETKNNAGYGFWLPSDLGGYDSIILRAKEDQVKDLYIGPRRTLKAYNIFSNIIPNGHEPLDASITSPWLNATRKVIYGANEIKVYDTVEVITDFIAGEEVRSKKFQKMKADLQDMFNVYIVFKR